MSSNSIFHYLANALQDIHNSIQIPNIIYRESKSQVSIVPRTFCKSSMASCTGTKLVWRPLKKQKEKHHQNFSYSQINANKSILIITFRSGPI